VVDAPVWAGEVWAFEIALPADVVERPVPRYRALPHLPAAERDLALIVPDGVSAHVVATAIRDAAGDDLEALDLFDLYTGAGVPEGARSLAYRLRFRSPTRTLKDAEVDKAVNTVLRRLEEGLGVQARG
jgi:phenylalanyl-tRNA synthetase beta chain